MTNIIILLLFFLLFYYFNSKTEFFEQYLWNSTRHTRNMSYDLRGEPY